MSSDQRGGGLREDPPFFSGVPRRSRGSFSGTSFPEDPSSASFRHLPGTQAAFDADLSTPLSTEVSPGLMWADTHYRDWLAPPQLPNVIGNRNQSAAIKRVGEAQRVRGPESYRGPSGISQSGLIPGGPFGGAPLGALGAPTGREFLGCVTGEAYVSPPSDSYPPGYPGGFSAGREDTPVKDVYLLAPDGDTPEREPTERLGRRASFFGSSAPLRHRSSGGPPEGSAGAFWGLSEGTGEGLWGPLEGSESGEGPSRRFCPLDVSKGPRRDRGPTDVLCLCLFIVGWCVLFYIVLRSLGGPSAEKLTAGIDWKGRACGVDAEVKNFPFLYWPAKRMPVNPQDNELKSCDLMPVCTASCPSSFSASRPPGSCDAESEGLGLCSWYGSKPSSLKLKRFCLFVNKEGETDDHGMLHSWFRAMGDLVLVWPVVVLIPIFSFSLSFGFFLFIQKAADFLLLVFVAAGELLLLSCSFYCFSLSHAAAAAARPAATVAAAAAAGAATVPLSALPGWLLFVLGAIFCLLAVSFLLLAVSYREQLFLCSAVVKAAAAVLSGAPLSFLLLLPLITAAAFATHVAFAMGGVLHLMAAGSVPLVSPASVCGADPWNRLSLGFKDKLVLAFVGIMSLWTGAFISGVCQLIVSYFTACCYFTPHDADRRQILKAKAREAFTVICRFHLGSAALGGLILSFVEFVRICLSWVRRLSARRNESVFRITLRVISTSLCVLYSFLSILNKSSLVYVSLLGLPLFRAAVAAAAAQKRNPLAVVCVWQAGRFVQLVGQTAVASAVTWGTYFTLTRIPGTYGQLSSLAAPLLFSFWISYNVASSCMKCFGFASLTLLQCYLADVEMSRQQGKGSPEFAPQALRLVQRQLLKRNDSGP